MFKNLILSRPLAVIDLETTGTNPQFDRIVEISVLKVSPGAPPEHRTRRLNPGVPIPAEAHQIHGIGDADVAGEPTFRDVAAGLLALLDGCDLCGFNMKRFDLPILVAEFRRAGAELSLDGRVVIDPMEIFHRYEPRDLAAAVRFYVGRDHVGGHSAKADVLATAEVLDAMLVRYDDLPREVDAIANYTKDPGQVDAGRRLRRVNGEVRITFGRFRGQPLAAVARREPDYLRWVLGGDFPDDLKAVVRDALAAVAAASAAVTGQPTGTGHEPPLTPSTWTTSERTMQ